ncbi:E3 ubiquitin-protein ligase RAD18 isoform X2 [Orussus abietinus]|uniref:E3 ubiquitin-protein ligase RAD18 isoform X2 n=1 Tax=Orussus abietinus TaxID=222816 RepID=UPI000625EA79|nr:E3 ubiquitin-protein ligase RAD18 isoform X2 [Orussus abietinus]
MGKFPEITWPADYMELKRIEDLLLCGICYEYMDTTVMTPCSHNYCSLCIRKYLHYKMQCPACFEKTFEKDLHTNRILDEIIECFLKVRDKLVTCISGAKIVTSEYLASPELPPTRPARSSDIIKTPRRLNKEKSDQVGDCNFKGHDVTPEQGANSPSTSGTQKVASIFTPKSKKEVSPTICGKVVMCPVCKVDILEIHINKHLDDCLKREATIDLPKQEEPKRKPLPKLVFNLMKDIELRKKLKDLGLQSQGDRKTLEMRLQRYSTLYNAECDKSKPRPISELIKQCEEEEGIEKKMQKSVAVNKLKVTRTTDESSIEEAQKKYLETHKSSFSALIDTIKNRESSKPSAKRSIFNKCNSSDLSASPRKPDCNRLVIEESDDSNLNCSYMDHNDLVYVDSDSDISCPLQWYRCEDPRDFVKTQLSNSRDTSLEENSQTFDTSEMNTVSLSTNQIDDDAHCESQSASKDDVKFEIDVPSSESTTLTGQIISSELDRTSKAPAFDPFAAPTDSDSTDEESTGIREKDKKYTKKRAKLDSSNKVCNLNTSLSDVDELKLSDTQHEQQEREKNARQLAMTIAEDFSFDISSNDSFDFSNNDGA